MKIFIMWFAIILGAFAIFAQALQGDLDWENAFIGACGGAIIFAFIQKAWGRFAERLKTLH